MATRRLRRAEISSGISPIRPWLWSELPAAILHPTVAAKINERLPHHSGLPGENHDTWAPVLSQLMMSGRSLRSCNLPVSCCDLAFAPHR
jgi:hypothetical protein